ncbi:MAG: hypothetical protein HUU37_03110 [Bdellovibrionales bacterium]|nr:hypothetical protein [Bdellovibrionales bacterium]
MRVLLLLLVVSLEAAASSVDSQEFADYAPAYSEDSTHRDESFLYFEKDYMVSLGSGVDRFSGLMGSNLRPAFPTLDVRFSRFFDFRKALEFRVTNARFAGTMNQDVLLPLGLAEMAAATTPSNNFAEVQFFRAGAGFKFYAENDTPALWGVSDRPFWSPNYFFGMGFSYGRLMIQMPQTGLEADLNMTVPHLSLGLDFFTRAPSTSTNRVPPTLGLEARYTFFGTWLKTIGYRNASGDSGSASLGNLLSLGILANFAF